MNERQGTKMIEKVLTVLITAIEQFLEAELLCNCLKKCNPRCYMNAIYKINDTSIPIKERPTTESELNINTKFTYLTKP